MEKTCYSINIAIYFNVLSPIKIIALSWQQEIHNSVKAVCKINEFSWTMAKLKLLDTNLIPFIQIHVCKFGTI